MVYFSSGANIDEEPTLSDKRWKGETGAFKGDLFLIKDIRWFLQSEELLIVQLDCDEITTQEFWKRRDKLLGEIFK